MNAKVTRRVVLVALLLALICVTLLVGYTYAWFTDTAETKSSRIVAGTLNVGLKYANSSTADTWVDVEELPDSDYAPFFYDTNGDPVVWEPGALAYASFRIENLGDRALKYELATLVSDFNTVENSDESLKDVIKLGAISHGEATLDADVPEIGSRENIISQISDWYYLDSNFAQNMAHNICLEAQKSDIVTLVLHWLPGGNDDFYNLKNGAVSSTLDPLYLDVDIQLAATQAMLESDSFDNTYDENAEYGFSGISDEKGLIENTDISAKTVTIESAEQLLAFAESVNNGNSYAGYEISLESDINLGGFDWTPIGNGSVVFEGNFNGNGHTVKDVHVAVDKNAGFFGSVSGNITALCIDDAYFNATDTAGAIAAVTTGNITDCVVTNTVVSAGDESGELGGNVGAVVGCAIADSTLITGNRASGVRLVANKNCGAIAGAVSADVSSAMAENTADNVGIKWSGYGVEGGNVGPNSDNSHVGYIKSDNYCG